MLRRLTLGFLFTLICVAPSFGEVHEQRVPLKPGIITTAAKRLTDWSWIGAFNRTMGEGCSVTVDGNELRLVVDPDQLPQSVKETKKIVRTFVAEVEPQATADYSTRLGLFLPKQFDPNGRLVVMIHGLDTDQAGFYRMNDLLKQTGYQTAYFVYPNDQPLDDSAAMLERHMIALRQSHPKVTVDLVCHSMGSIVARAYIEGAAYAGGIDHFILLGPPNQGSQWTNWRWMLEMRDHVRLVQNDPKWHPSWMITDGLGEAGTDLEVGSEFLTRLNACNRRDGVKYTIIAGNQHTLRRVTADIVDGTISHLPSWRITQKMQNWSTRFRNREDNADGPVDVASTFLNGVADVVVLKADHDSLYLPIGTDNPASWETIRARLAK